MSLQIGWAQADITPEKPVLIAGNFPARLSEGVRDPLYAVVLVLQSGDEQVVMVCCDVVSISDDLRDAVRSKVRNLNAEIQVEKIVINATHSHTAPEIRVSNPQVGGMAGWGNGVELGEMSVEEYLDFASTRIAEAVNQAWESRANGGVAYGLGYAVLGRNRRWVDQDGVARMYGLNAETAERFAHVEGFEDHSVNLLATYDAEDNLTGIIFNAPMTAQEDGGLFVISADLWCEARQELRRRFGENLFVMTQVSAAGELTPKLIYEGPANNRMQELKGRTGRQEMATRIANAVEDILPYLPQAIEKDPLLKHVTATVELPVNALTQQDVEAAQLEVDKLQALYDEEMRKLEEDPALKENPRWYVPATAAFRRRNWQLGVVTRYEQYQQTKTQSADLHVIRLGDIVFATNPFEYYLDFGIQVKVRSPFIQTFLVELAGPGTYVPSLRSTQGGGYGSVPASNRIGPEGGQVLADETVRLIRTLWAD